eukprot:sb/3465383/
MSTTTSTSSTTTSSTTSTSSTTIQRTRTAAAMTRRANFSSNNPRLHEIGVQPPRRTRGRPRTRTTPEDLLPSDFGQTVKPNTRDMGILVSKFVQTSPSTSTRRPDLGDDLIETLMNGVSLSDALRWNAGVLGEVQLQGFLRLLSSNSLASVVLQVSPESLDSVGVGSGLGVDVGSAVVHGEVGVPIILVQVHVRSPAVADDDMMDPGRIRRRMMGRRVASSLLLAGQISKKASPVTWSTPPKTQVPSTRRPRWYFRFPCLLSSIWTITPGPPIIPEVVLISSCIFSRIMSKNLLTVPSSRVELMAVRETVVLFEYSCRRLMNFRKGMGLCSRMLCFRTDTEDPQGHLQQKPSLGRTGYGHVIHIYIYHCAGKRKGDHHLPQPRVPESSNMFLTSLYLF